MSAAITPLAAGFEAPDRDAWLGLVEKTLKGASLDTLVTKTADGLAIQPLYAASTAPALPSWRAGTAERPWDIRCVTVHPDPARANRDILEDLEGGAASVLVQVNNPADLAQVLTGVMTDLAPVALSAGFLGPQATDALAAIAKSAPGAPLAFHMDPVTAFARSGSSPGPIDSHIIAAATAAARHAETYPKATFALASGQAAHEAGGSEAQELAFMAASAVTYLRALTRAGVSPLRALAGIVLGLAVDQDYFVSIAKLRAARRIWGRISEACGTATPARIEARSSRRMLTVADPWTNLVRLTASSFAGAVGGADAIVLGAFTDAIGLPALLARRQARNTQLVLMEEAHLGRVADPAAGSGFVEDLTDQLAAKAWSLFQDIERAGGLVAALRAGTVQSGIAAARAALTADIQSGERKILGVTDFKPTEEAPVDTEAFTAQPEVSARLPGPDSVCDALPAWRLEEAV